MVLLTSGAVSVILSSAVVCTFTFLLFLSGYVLQQQTVRSLQEAIRQPPERRPVPTLPAKFRVQETESFETLVKDNLDGSVESIVVGATVEGGGSLSRGAGQVLLEDDQTIEQALNEIEAEQGLRRLKGSTESRTDSSYEQLAYFFALHEPSDLCSALQFAAAQRNSTNLSIPPSIVLLYPSTWESSATDSHTSVLTFMRNIQDSYGLVYHPVPINEKLGLTAQLLGELQWTRWSYDRGMYLRLPGIATDTQLLDDALRHSSWRKSWGPVSAGARADPEIMLYTPQGLQIPRKGMRQLAASLKVMETFEDQVYFESHVRTAGYVLLDEETPTGLGDQDPWLHNVLEDFERGRSGVCAGSNLMTGSV